MSLKVPLTAAGASQLRDASSANLSVTLTAKSRNTTRAKLRGSAPSAASGAETGGTGHSGVFLAFAFAFGAVPPALVTAMLRRDTPPAP